MSDKPRKVHSYIPELSEQLRKGEIDRREFLRTATLLGVSASAAYAMAGKLTGDYAVPQARAAGKKGGKIKISMRSQEMTDPAKFDWTEKSNVARQIVEYATITGADNVTRPYLLEGWQASDDLKSWTLNLRKGIKWSNGDEFNADDIAFNFERWLSPKTGSSNLGLFSSMVTTTDTGKKDKNGKAIMSKSMTPGAVEKIDSHTVRLNLNRAELAVPENLYNYPTAIVHRRFDDEGGDLSKNPVGTGPFALKGFAVGEKADLVKRNPADYWGEEVFLDAIQYIDHGDDASAGLAALASGQVDLVYETFVEQIDVVEKLPNIVLYEAVTAQTGVARMQMDSPPFDNPKLREAIRLCQDHQALLDIAYRGRGAPAQDHHVAPVHPEYAPMDTPKQDYARAKKLLAEAGHAGGISVKLDVKKEPPWEVAVAQALAEQCKPAGITININVMPNAQYWEIWDKTDFGFTAWTHRPLGVMVHNLAYRSGVPWNESHHNDPEYDRLLDIASGTLDVNERRKHMAAVQARLQQNGVIAQPLWRSIFAAGHKKVQGYKLHPTNYHQLNKVSLA